MARELYADSTIPSSGKQSIPYPDHAKIVNEMLKHGAEMFMGSVTGAGGAGGDLESVPFEPALVLALNPAGATPAVHVSAFAAAADHMTIAAAAAANANPPTLTQVGTNDWTVGLTTQMAPDGETLTVICVGFRDVNSSE